MCSHQTVRQEHQILSYWWMLELFSPQPVPKLTSRASRPKDRQVIQWSPGDDLPWETLQPPEPFGKTPAVWQHTVYLGVYELDATYETLHRVFTDHQDAYDEPRRQRSACAAILLNDEGRLVNDASVLSTTLWAVSRIHDPGPEDPGWANGFESAQGTFTTTLDAYLGELKEHRRTPDVPVLDAIALSEILKLAHCAAGVQGIPDLATECIVIASRAVSARRSEDAGYSDFLNSFYLEDLANVRSRVAQGDIGPALAQYLTGEADVKRQERIDIVQQPDAVDEKTQLADLPKGRWLSNPKHHLALSQQFAVNQALNNLGPTAGLMGVNGPPGTGKTTMLRDILAANVVERARRIAALKHPDEAFTSQRHVWLSSTGYHQTVPQLIPELTGFEMVVASANNAAVENISHEIPESAAIDSSWHGTADYFGDIATAVLHTAAGDTSNDSAAEAWGLVAARLGSKDNRMKFRSAFWFGQNASSDKDSRCTGLAMQTRLKHWANATVKPISWDTAREAFRAAERRVDELIAERQAASGRLTQKQVLPDQVRALENQLVNLQEQLAWTEAQAAKHERAEQQAAQRYEQAEAAYSRHLAIKPSVLETLFTFGKTARLWREDLEPLRRELDTAAERSAAAGERLHSSLQALVEIRADLEDLTTKLTHSRSRMAGLDRVCRADEERYGKGYPGPAWCGDQRELHAPWLDAELDTARSELFLAALKLHEDLIANTASEVIRGLRAAMEVMTGEYPPALSAEKVLAAWQLLFLVVPLVSTTFASLGRMFGDLGAEDLGWLLIDEAGQASPQYAAGAIWRARRVVAVGDPLQLEPVVTVPNKMLHDIAATYHLSSTWIPPKASVQTLADRVSKFGTVLPQGDEDLWVSAPLKVHRRCDDPMFSLCNEIAYNNMMINGVSDRAAADADDPFVSRGQEPDVAWSYWADERAQTSGTHLQHNEIQRFEKAMAYLQHNGVDASQVIAISPFRDVADRLAALQSQYPGLLAGTIHTAQGREAPVVILVLGGDPKRPGAKAWAASSVNLVNVAASRAKRRLFVIGDRREWSKHNYFRQLSDALN